MKNRFWIGNVICLLIVCLAMATGFGEDFQMTEGRTEGLPANLGILSGIYLYNYGEDYAVTRWSTDFLREGIGDTGGWEKATQAWITQTAGDESLKDAFVLSDQEGRYELVFQPEIVSQDGEASYRIELVSEHYWFSKEFTAQFVDMEKVHVALMMDPIICTVGEAVKVGWSSVRNFFRIDTDVGSTNLEFLDKNGGNFRNTSQYTLQWEEFTAKEPGNYDVLMRLEMGTNQVTRNIPVTMHALPREEAIAAWEKSWPPEGLQEATAVGSSVEKLINGYVFIGGESGQTTMPEFTLTGKDGTEEGTTNVYLTFMGGDEDLRNLISPDSCHGTGCTNTVRIDTREITEQGTVEYRVDMNSEHYWATRTLHFTVMHTEDVRTELTSSDVYIPVDQPTNIIKLYEQKQFFRTDPAFDDSEMRYWILPVNGEEETDAYECQMGMSFTAKQAGDYPMILKVRLGLYGYEQDCPITIHASDETETAAVAGDAPLTEKGLREQEALRQQRLEVLEHDKQQGDLTVLREDAWFLCRPTDDGTVIVKILPMGEKLVIPAELEGYPVTAVGPRALEYNREVTGIKIEEGIQSIREYAFSYMDQLEFLELPESLTEIERYAFCGCHKLHELKLPVGLKKDHIGSNAFKEVAMDDILLEDGTSLMAMSLKEYREYGIHYAENPMSLSAGGVEYLIREDGGAVALGYNSFDRQAENRTMLILPEHVNGHPVREIGAQAFINETEMEKAVLPEGMETIGKTAFSGCKNLREVQLPQTVKEIGENAFRGIAAQTILLPEGAEKVASNWFSGAEQQDGTGKWTYRRLPDGTAVICGYPLESVLSFPAEVDGIPVTEIEEIAFYDELYEDRNKVKQVIIPEGVLTLGEEVFMGLKNLKKITLPGSLEQIGDRAFSSSGLTAVTISEGAESIGTEMFADCRSLRTVKLPSTLREIGERAFIRTGLETVQLPEGLETIGKEAFAWSEISSMKLPESLKVIGDLAFAGHNLGTVIIPAGVETVGNGAFQPVWDKAVKKAVVNGVKTQLGRGVFGYDNGSDRYVQTHGDSKGYDSYNPDNWIDYYADQSNEKTETIIVSCYPGSTADRLYQYNVKKSYLKWGAEGICTAPSEPVLQAGIFDPEEVFFELIIPEGVEEIAENTLAGQITLNRVKLPSTLKKIGARAFADCSALEEITLPRGMEEIGEACFMGCSQLEKINLPDGISKIPREAFRDCTKLNRLTTQNGTITEIGDYAFAGCEALTSLQMKKGLERIGNYAFQSCGLQSARMPDSVREIGEGAFMFCLSLGEVNLPEGLESIGEGAFMQNVELVKNYYQISRGKKSATALKSVKIPASLKTIGTGAFAGCDALTRVTFAKGSQLEKIGDQAFGMCLRLKEIALPDSLQEIGAGAFMNCIDMKKVRLGNGITKAGAEMLKYCGSLTELVVPDSLTDIGDRLLEGHGDKLKVTCGEGSAMDAWLQANDPGVMVARPR